MLAINHLAHIRLFALQDNGTTMANSRLPALFYQGVLDVAGLPDQGLQDELRGIVGRNRWDMPWVDRNAVYTYPHLHSNTHEVLAVLAGSGRIKLGGDERYVLHVRRGDAIAIAAGAVHQRVSPDNDDFVVAGLYPAGAEAWDLLEPSAESRRKVLDARVPLPETDPFFGRSGKLTEYWT